MKVKEGAKGLTGVKRVVYYTEAGFLDLGLSFINEMSRLAELHVLLQVRPRQWPEGQLDLSPAELPAGILAAGPALFPLPDAVRALWRNVASFGLVVHNEPQALHPANGWVSHQAIQHIHRLAPDVVHLEGLPGRLAWVLPELRGCPIVLTVHDPEPHSGAHGWKDSLARRISFARAERFILHNRVQKGIFCLHYGLSSNRVDVIPLGAYHALRAWAGTPRTDDGRTVLFFGQISPYKGLETLYRAAPLVAERVSGVRFVVAGKASAGYTPPAPPRLPNGGSIEVLGRHVRNAELARLFQESTLVVCPYTDATQSGVVLTAYAFTKPVVATRIGGLPEYVRDGETGALVRPRAAKELAGALCDVLQRIASVPGEREAYRRRIEAFCQGTLSWPQIARQTAESYDRACVSYARRHGAGRGR